MKKSLIGLAAFATLATLASCGPTPGGSNTDRPNPDKAFNTDKALDLNENEIQDMVLGNYDAKYREALKFTKTNEIEQRYKAFAAAEYTLIYDDAVIIPYFAASGYVASVSKTVPYQSGRASYGLTNAKLKDVVVTTQAITKDQRDAVVSFYKAHKDDKVEPSVGEDGYISLENQFKNPAVDSQGKYTYAGQTFQTKKEYKTTFSTDINKDKLNYLTNSWTYNSDHYANMVDGLVENDKYGNLVGAIAESYKVVDNSDGTQTWTFKLKHDIPWVDNKTGNEYKEGNDVQYVKADDFVAGIEYVLNPYNFSATAGIVYGLLAGAENYFNEMNDEGESDFSKVGVKAIDDYTLSYTLKESTPYFLSSLTYSPFLPVNRNYLEMKGSNFGSSADNILVNGAFRLTDYVTGTAGKIVYTKNDKYWDAEHVYVDTVTSKKISGNAGDSETRNLYKAGEIDAFVVNNNDTTGWKLYVTGDNNEGSLEDPVSPECNSILNVGDSTFIGYFNYRRTTWEYTDNANKKNYYEKLASAKAVLNKNFRLGFLYGLKVDEYLKYYSKDEPINYLMRSYVNRELCFYDGTDYCDYVDAYYREKNGIADTNFTLTGALEKGTKIDPIYNADKAKEYFKKAKEELLADGLEEIDFPIKIDVMEDMSVSVSRYQEAMFKALMDNSDGVVKIQYNTPKTDDQNTTWGSITYNYDFSMFSGWGPDYADPNTFLHTMCKGGDMVESMGF